jgi:hypothetical protein
VPLSDITPRVVETFYEDLKGRSVGEGDEARPLAVATVNRYMKLLHAVLRLGVKRGMLLTNPAASVDLASENNARVRCLSPDANPLHIQHAGGWKTPSMMQRYSHLDPETIKATVERLAYRKESASVVTQAWSLSGLSRGSNSQRAAAGPQSVSALSFALDRAMTTRSSQKPIQGATS